MDAWTAAFLLGVPGTITFIISTLGRADSASPTPRQLADGFGPYLAAMAKLCRYFQVIGAAMALPLLGKLLLMAVMGG